MTDIHSHILPEIDDGAKSLEIALELLKSHKKQGCSAVIATPHFYPQTMSLEDFEAVRKEKADMLFNAVKNAGLPEIVLGCELHYFFGFDSCDCLDKFCLGNSKYILLELAFTGSIGRITLESIKAVKKRGYIPIIAHIERYRWFRGFRNLKKLIEDGYALAQVNASSLLEKRIWRTVIKLIDNGYVSFVASDAHSLEHRPVMLKEAYGFIGEKLGKLTVKKLIRNSDKLLSEIKD